jgi:hypothetical protein
MKSEIKWTVAAALAVIFSLTSMPSYAQSVLISAESGNLVPIDGVWEFPGCFEPDPEEPDELYDQREYLVFDGDTVESRVVFYSSSDGSCTGNETVETEGPFPIQSNGEVLSPGWGEVDDFGFVNPLPPPLRQDSSGPLNSAPLITEWQIDLGNGEVEIGYNYIDDTGDTWYLYRNAGEDDAPTLYMSPEEPLLKVDIVFEPEPECEIELTQETYFDGDTIMADVFRVSNPTSERLALEVKAWMVRPDESVKSVFNIGAYGFFRLWPETDIDLGPFWLGRVHQYKPRGEYELGCRVLDPRTGALIAEDRVSFEIQ